MMSTEFFLGFLSYFKGVSVEFLWDFYEMFVVYLRDAHGFLYDMSKGIP